ncbi:hypothetical protein [Desulfonatronovibrio magnus]|uniref:hypothetical protein n=1 Tax=Desulfonatronovibrio magnus TaxID=698827 RepID=UPI0012FA26B3|nr:hypothetical protein [Desulfonatronovibrio magnus]
MVEDGQSASGKKTKTLIVDYEESLKEIGNRIFHTGRKGRNTNLIKIDCEHKP